MFAYYLFFFATENFDSVPLISRLMFARCLKTIIPPIAAAEIVTVARYTGVI